MTARATKGAVAVTAGVAAVLLLYLLTRRKPEEMPVALLGNTTDRIVNGSGNTTVADRIVNGSGNTTVADMMVDGGGNTTVADMMVDGGGNTTVAGLGLVNSSGFTNTANINGTKSPPLSRQSVPAIVAEVQAQVREGNLRRARESNLSTLAELNATTPTRPPSMPGTVETVNATPNNFTSLSSFAAPSNVANLSPAFAVPNLTGGGPNPESAAFSRGLVITPAVANAILDSRSRLADYEAAWKATSFFDLPTKLYLLATWPREVTSAFDPSEVARSGSLTSFRVDPSTAALVAGLYGPAP